MDESRADQLSTIDTIDVASIREKSVQIVYFSFLIFAFRSDSPAHFTPFFIVCATRRRARSLASFDRWHLEIVPHYTQSVFLGLKCTRLFLIECRICVSSQLTRHLTRLHVNSVARIRLGVRDGEHRARRRCTRPINCYDHILR